MVDECSPPKRSAGSVLRASGRPLDRQEGTWFEEFYRSEYRAVLVLARVLTGDPHSAEDVTQDAFTAAWQAWEHLDNPPAWVRRVVTNKAKSSWRRRYAERRAMTSLASEATHSPEMPAETETFWAQVRRLPARQAQAVTLFYLEDLSIAEIAEVLGCAPATVRVHLTRGRRTLAARLEMSDDD